VAIADSVQRGGGITVGLLGGQDVFTVPSMAAKLDAQLRGLGGGSLPEAIARPYIDAGHLVERRLERHRPLVHLAFAWRKPTRGQAGQALQWWIDQLDRPTTRAALLGEQRRHATPTAGDPPRSGRAASKSAKAR
jgi:DNA-binding transcriptional LysR family regulator